MQEPEEQEILGALEAGRDAFREALAGVDEELASRKPRPDAWSILECVEHVAVGERFLLSKLTSASPSDRRHENRAREAAIVARGADRTRPGKSPEAALPRGRFLSLEEAVADFERVRAETVQYVEGFSGDPRCWLTDHPLIPGPVNCYEILLIMSGHPARHAKQIAEIRDSA